MTRSFRATLVGVLLALGGAVAHAGPAIDEATYPGAGTDYNNLLSPPSPVAEVFALEGGTNTFAGTFGPRATPATHSWSSSTPPRR